MTISSSHRLRLAALGIVFFGAVFALMADRLLPNWPKIYPLPAYEGTGRIIGESSWIENAVSSGAPASRYKRLANRGSSIGGDDFTGEHVTGWYRAVPRVIVLVTGGPTRPGNRLVAEVRRKDGPVDVLPFAGDEPGEGWQPWAFDLPADAVAFRLRATDGSTGFRGWLGFTEPCVVSVWETISWKMTVQLLGSVALALTLVWGPGLAFAASRGRGPGWEVLWFGPLLLVAGGGACWALGGTMPLRAIASGWIVATLLAVAVVLWRHRAWRLWSAAETRVLALVVICVLGAAAKAAFSGGPYGELYGGRMSRSLEASGHSDSRISYHTVQLVGNHFAPHGPESRGYFAPWNFSSRGPLAGLAASPIVLATAGRPPTGMPEQTWEPFDSGSFAAYRITIGALGALGLLAAFNLLRLVADERRAQLGAGLLALAPFFWHELYFSWPKAVTAAWVVGAFALVWQRRAFLGGLALGGAYLWHPLALLSAPFLALWTLVEPRDDWRRGLTRAAVFSSGVLLMVIGWQAVNHGHNAQAGFIRYFDTADEGYATLRTWPLSRWNNFANTLIPFYVLIVNVDHPSYGAFGVPSDRWLLFFRQCWTAAPFAVGFVAWCAWLAPFMRGIRRHWRVALVCVIGPFVLLTVYWGGASTGLMREAGQPLFLAGWIFLAWSTTRPVWSPTVLTLLTIAATAEVLGMMFLPSLAPASRHFSTDLFLNDCLWLVVAVACVGTAAGISRRMLAAAGESDR